MAEGRPQTRVPSRSAWAAPTSLLWCNAGRLRFFLKKKKLSKELHSDSEVEVPLCTLSPFRRHPPSAKTWDLRRPSTYQQHPKPNCYASCRVLTPTAPCDCVGLFGRSSILGTVLGGCSRSAFWTVPGSKTPREESGRREDEVLGGKGPKKQHKLPATPSQ